MATVVGEALVGTAVGELVTRLLARVKNLLGGKALADTTVEAVRERLLSLQAALDAPSERQLGSPEVWKALRKTESVIGKLEESAHKWKRTRLVKRLLVGGKHARRFTQLEDELDECIRDLNFCFVAKSLSVTNKIHEETTETREVTNKIHHVVMEIFRIVRQQTLHLGLWAILLAVFFLFVAWYVSPPARESPTIQDQENSTCPSSSTPPQT